MKGMPPGQCRPLIRITHRYPPSRITLLDSVSTIFVLFSTYICLFSLSLLLRYPPWRLIYIGFWFIWRKPPFFRDKILQRFQGLIRLLHCRESCPRTTHFKEVVIRHPNDWAYYKLLADGIKTVISMKCTVHPCSLPSLHAWNSIFKH